jgi:hypothetical protein
MSKIKPRDALPFASNQARNLLEDMNPGERLWKLSPTSSYEPTISALLSHPTRSRNRHFHESSQQFLPLETTIHAGFTNVYENTCSMRVLLQVELRLRVMVVNSGYSEEVNMS